jgi:Putative Flp pilus-assembly TadE/G-like/von Willebrand factor type A domain
MHAILQVFNLSRQVPRQRRGAVAVLAAMMIVMLLGFVAFAVDTGMIALTRARLQNNADAAALAAAQELSGVDDPAIVRARARQAALETVLANVGDASNAHFDAESDVVFGRQVWNASTRKFDYFWGDEQTPYNVVKVIARREMREQEGGADERLPLSFAPVIGVDKVGVETSAVASFQPRDIVVVLDFSHSMCYDSMFYRLGLLGRTRIENSLQEIWQDLGSPVYGNLTFSPRFLTFRGVPAAGAIPHVDVTWRGTQVDVASTSNITSVRLRFSNNSTQTIAGSGPNGTFKGSGGNNGKEIVQAWVLSGGNVNVSPGGFGESFSFSNTAIIANLGLSSVTYPYPSGSWNAFVDYVTGGSTDIIDAGYQYQFGAMLWVNYIQDDQGSYAQTPDLWRTRQQPTAILKQGVNLFINYLQDMEADDKVGLSVYSRNSPSGAVLELGLSSNVEQVKTITMQRQAGHYDPYTNIGGGMQLARRELEANARPNAHRLMVVMTDGMVNRPTNAATGRALVISEASAAVNSKIKILTISMGIMADTALMQQVADTTGGEHFPVAGGSSFEEYQAQLLEAFRRIAASRPLKLVRGE